MQINSFLDSSKFCRLLIIFTNSLDPDRDSECQSRPGSKPFDTLIVVLKEFFEKVNVEKKVSRRQQKHEMITNMQRVKNI